MRGEGRRKGAERGREGKGDRQSLSGREEGGRGGRERREEGERGDDGERERDKQGGRLTVHALIVLVYVVD